MTTAYVVHNRWALGDTVCLSAFVRDLAITYPGQFHISHAGHYLSFWENNPHCRPLDSGRNAPVLHMDYSVGMERSKAGLKIHFLSWFHREFERLTGVKVPVLKPRGDIHLTLQEKQKRLVSGRYWVVIAGGKKDLTAKWWYYHRYQEVVDELRKRGIVCVQAGAHFQHHVQPQLRDCLDLTGQTNSIRDLFSLIYHAEGVICGITGPMHVAAAFEKPCVVVAGGREECWWESYTNTYGQFGPTCEPVRVEHRFLHTIGTLDCCRTNGCWKSRTVPLERSDFTNPKHIQKLCLKPHRDPQQTVPECMDMIQTQHVVEAVMSYYERGEIPPVTAPQITPKPVEPVVSIQPPPELAHQHLDVQGFGDLGPPPQLLIPLKSVKPAPPPQELPPSVMTEDPAFSILDNPLIGGKYTVCVLGWGDNKNILERCLTSIFHTLPESRRDIRLALNQPSKAVREYVRSIKSKVTKLYVDEDRSDGFGVRRKYPAMREMFYDETCPITTKYLIWFDDDTYPVDGLWAVRLTETILSNHLAGARLFGRKVYHDLNIYRKEKHNPRVWFERGSWWQNEQLRLKGVERLAPNGSCIDFVAGWFWALNVETMRAANIPDERLNHNGGDITIGAQVHQAGGKIKNFNDAKQYVYTPPKEQGGRRGYSEEFPWSGR